MLNFGLRKLADNYMQIWNAESEGLLDIYADPALQVEYTHFDGICNGIEDYKKILQSTYRSFPDMEVTITDILPNKKDGSVTLFWNYSGTHQNTPLFGVNPSGKKISVNAMTVLKIKDEKVIYEKGIIDNLSLLMQLTT